MRRYVGYILIFLLAVSAAGCRPKNKAAGTALPGRVVSISEASISSDRVDTMDIGYVRECEKVSVEYRLRNESDRPMVINNMDAGCGCLLFSYSREPLAPGREREMEFTFDSAGLYGEIIRVVYFHTTLSQKPYKLVVTARVK